MADPNSGSDGAPQWRGLRWYPLQTIHYAAGIAAIAGDQYSALRTLFETQVRSEQGERLSCLEAVIDALGEVEHPTSLFNT